MSSSAAIWRPIVTEILRERLGAGESIWLPIRGRSMRPLLRSGALILVAPAARVRFGDVLAYESEGTLVCHRVIGRRGAALLTRADHRAVGPELVTLPQIVGIVTAFERRGVTVDLRTGASTDAGDPHRRALVRGRGVALRAAGRRGAGAPPAEARRATAGVAARVTRYIDTVDVAGVAFQLSCRFPKPGFWARNRPEFITRRRPDVTVRIDYEERFERRTKRPVGDTVADAARVSRRGRHLLVATGYYRATVDVPHAEVAVRMAAGFDVSGLMRTLAALWLLERETLLVRAACFGPGASTTLACGLPDWATPPSALVGWFAVTPRRDGVGVRPTPFVDRNDRLHASGRRATTLWLPAAVVETRPPGATAALRALFPSIWQADRRRPAVERTLDLATRVVTSLRCREVVVSHPARDEAAVG